MMFATVPADRSILCRLAGFVKTAAEVCAVVQHVGVCMYVHEEDLLVASGNTRCRSG